MAQGDIYQIQVFQTFSALQDDVLNVFYYRAEAAASSNANDVLSVFSEQEGDSPWEAARTIQRTNMVTTLYRVINGNDNQDYVEAGASDAGTKTSLVGACPIFVAVGFRGPRPGPGVRYSYKRIGGIPSDYLASNSGSWAGDAGDDFQVPQDAFGLELEGDFNLYAPVQITGGFSLGVAPTFSYSLVGNWTTNVYPSHQVSRANYDWQRLSS